MPNHRPLSPLQLRLCSYVITVLLLYFLVLDSFGGSRTVFKLTGIESQDLIVPAFLALFYLRLRMRQLFSGIIERFFHSVLLVLTIVVSVLTLYGALTPANTVFALTRLHLSQLWVLCLVLLNIILLNQSNSWWKSHWRKVIFRVPFVAFYALFLATYFPFDYFDGLVKEDHLIEYCQFLVLVVGAVWGGWNSAQLFAKRKFVWASLLLVSAASLALVAGDEIAWGQRLLGIEVSDAVKTLNRQEELTIHNLYAVEWLVWFGYAGVALFGVSGRFLVKRLSRSFVFLKSYVQFCPPWFSMGYFLLPLLFYSAHVVARDDVGHLWAEVAELSLYTGAVLWLVMICVIIGYSYRPDNDEI